MDRRAFIGTFASSLLVVPLITHAQQTEKVVRIGLLPAIATSPGLLALREEMASLRERQLHPHLR